MMHYHRMAFCVLVVVVPLQACADTFTHKASNQRMKGRILETDTVGRHVKWLVEAASGKKAWLWAAQWERIPDRPAKPACAKPELRTWTDTNGKFHVEAAFACLKNGEVKFRESEGEAPERSVGSAQ